MSHMASSSYSSRNNVSQLSFKNKVCINSKNRAVVKVSESDKNSGKLYYSCNARNCNYFEWVHSINYGDLNENFEETSNPTPQRVVGTKEVVEESLLAGGLEVTPSIQQNLPPITVGIMFGILILLVIIVILLSLILFRM
ncbi:hypothetical protein QJS10_CPB17g00943 [Acorus calamus]|uniref:GRF-type domain-containing protein n=1 Tax=Acorus calamus TaxID=4465 RepID=A0AAV9CWC2_ACOCL|nr:hypothetical protein QJS10_CPB17g00943 [Acorus calamus]